MHDLYSLSLDTFGYEAYLLICFYLLLLFLLERKAGREKIKDIVPKFLSSGRQV